MNTVSLENSLKAMEKNAEYGGQPKIFVLVHETKALYLENFLLIALAMTFFIIQKNMTTKENQ